MNWSLIGSVAVVWFTSACFIGPILGNFIRKCAEMNGEINHD